MESYAPVQFYIITSFSIVFYSLFSSRGQSDVSFLSDRFLLAIWALLYLYYIVLLLGTSFGSVELPYQDASSGFTKYANDALHFAHVLSVLVFQMWMMFFFIRRNGQVI